MQYIRLFVEIVIFTVIYGKVHANVFMLYIFLASTQSQFIIFMPMSVTRNYIMALTWCTGRRWRKIIETILHQIYKQWFNNVLHLHPVPEGVQLMWFSYFCRGTSKSNKHTAFRVWFPRLNEFRSLLLEVPFVALTATATTDARETIFEVLGMREHWKN